MPNTLDNIKKFTVIIYGFIFLLSIFVVIQFLARVDLPIKQISIIGEYQHIDKEQVDLIANEYIEGNFFSINLDQTRHAFKKLAWVREIAIRKKFPDTLEVTIEEHKPIARWGRVGLVNSYGEIFNAASQEELPSFIGYETFVKEMTLKFMEMNKILSKELMQVGTITLSERLSWEVITDNQVRVILGKDNIIKKLNLFTNNYQNILAGLKNRIEYVDLRYKDGFSVKKLQERSIKKPKEKNNL
ncbi:FtsQ-type POTRA domain-containing protein [Methylophilaceae bacterium]|nr:FtsQ-type POTRA domain-containing protein [Methylophilaceae bacterium]